jgi:hypothetical protein
LREAAQGYSEEALSVLAGVMRDTEAPPAAKVAAARELLDRGFGRPMQSVENKIEIQSMADTAAQVLMELSRKAKEAKRLEAEARMIDVTP